jgi:hypothetical protein
VLLVVLLVVGVGGVAFWFWRARKNDESSPGAQEQHEVEQAPSKPLGAAGDAGPPLGELHVWSPGEPVKAVPFGRKPLTVGSAADAEVVLPREPGIAPNHVRLWWRDGRLMLHHLDRTTTTLVNGQSAQWVTLDPGDRISIGGHELSYAPHVHPEETPAHLAPLSTRDRVSS